MEYESISTAVVVGLGALAAFNLIWAAYKNLKEAQKPSHDLKAQVEAHAEMLDRDNKRLRELETGQKLQLRALKQLLRHEVDGNHKEKLQEVEHAIDEHLINR